MEPVELRLNEDRYGITRGPNSASGKIAVRDSEISFYASTACEGVGTYQWTLAGDELTFTAVGEEPCPGRGQVLNGITYTRAP